MIFNLTYLLPLLLTVFSGSFYVYADSSSLGRNEYTDLLEEDWVISGDLERVFNESSYKPIVKNVNNGGAFVDIQAVTYSVGEEFLNSTILFNSDLSKITNLLNLSYGMRIDVDSNRNTGLQGWDFLLRVSLDNNTLNRQLFELFPDGFAIVRHSNSNSSFSGLSQYSADVNLDLNEINKPARFTVTYFVENIVAMDNGIKAISDVSDWFIIPPFDVSMKAEPDQFDIHAGESRMVEWSINSSSKVQGITSFFVSDIPVSTISPYFPRRGITDLVVEVPNKPECYQSALNSEIITNAKKIRNLLSIESNYTEADLKSIIQLYNITQTSNELKEINKGQVKGLKIIRNPTIDDFSNFDTYHHTVEIETLENASRGLTYLTIKANVFDPKLENTLDYYYSPESGFGPEAFSRCLPKYHQSDLGEAEIDVRINVLPPKDLLKKLNDYLRNYDILVALLIAFISGGVLFTGIIKWPKIFRVFHKLKIHRNMNKKK